MFSCLGVVVIGRNEGERFKACAASLLQAGAASVVYVDSGSSDGSVPWARVQGLEVVELDMAQPFTAARARNEGFRRLLAVQPDVEFVQFVDGDCVLKPGWLTEALKFLAAHPLVAVCCGRRRERFPERSIYNRLCDLEWDTPLGEALACGGDALMRVTAFTQVGGYRDDLIAGEEPELCVRLRAQGWKIWRLDCEMTLHDAAMTRLSQWWRRTLRGGYAFALGAALHGAPPERHWVKETRSAVFWGMGLPLLALLLGALSGGWGLLILLAYPLQCARLWWCLRVVSPAAGARAFFLVLGKFSEAAGVGKFWLDRLGRKPAALIEYK